MKTTVYKLIHLDAASKRTSWLVLGKASKFYEPGVTHRAPKWLAVESYHLTAFDSLANLKYFTDGFYSYCYEIWECEATGVFDDLPKLCEPLFLQDGKLIKKSSLWPKGTVMCKTLKLIRKVK